MEILDNSREPGARSVVEECGLEGQKPVEGRLGGESVVKAILVEGKHGENRS